jgi:hypothetical protein
LASAKVVDVQKAPELMERLSLEDAAGDDYRLVTPSHPRLLKTPALPGPPPSFLSWLVRMDQSSLF